MQLAALEKALLRELATASGNILENKALISSLNETKEKSTTIKVSLDESQALQATLDQQREMYRPLAHIGSRVFFLTKDLKAINHMYQISLTVYLNLFETGLQYEGGKNSGQKVR